MKRFLTLILAFLIALSCLAGCKKEDPDAALYDESMPKKLLNSQVENFPIASDATDYQQRRQMCVDFFKLHLDFQWKPNIDVEDYVSYYSGSVKGLLKNNLYEGIPYGGVASGSIYRWMEYYDQTTGIMDLETAFAENGGWGEGAYIDNMKVATNMVSYPRYRSLMALFNQCSSAPGWAWGRVINTARFGMTKHTNVYNGYVPVGCYSYGYEHEGKQYTMTDIDVFGEKTEKNPIGYDTPEVIRDINREDADALYKCYAQLKPGDCLVNEGHQLMVTSVTLFKDDQGNVDYSLSSVSVMEQIDAWAKQSLVNDTLLLQQGRTEGGYMFSTLMEDKYIPFTFVELLDPNDQQDKKHLDYYNSYAHKLTAVRQAYSEVDFAPEMNGTAVEKGQVYNSLGKAEGNITVSQLQQLSVASNYSVDSVFVTVTDKDGNQQLKNIWRSECYHSREVSMTVTRSTFDKDSAGNLSTLCTDVEALANGENVIEIALQISTGEKLTAFRGTLTK